MTITSSGTVGINQGSPSSTYKLDVGGGIRSSGDAPSYTLREDDASSQTWLMASYGGTFAVRDTTVSGTAYPFQIEAATPSNTLFLDSSGNVGVGTTSPNEALEVSGNIQFTTSVGTTSARPAVSSSTLANGRYFSLILISKSFAVLLDQKAFQPLLYSLIKSKVVSPV